MDHEFKRILFWSIIVAALCSVTPNEICKGDPWNLHENGLSFSQTLINKRANCSIIDGNLLIMESTSGSFNFSGLQKIRKITGLLLISNVSIGRFEMKSLQVIEGRILDKNSVKVCGKRGCSLIVKDNQFETISFPQLTEISNGDVVFGDNQNLCYFYDNIDWTGILSSDNVEKRKAHWLDSTDSKCQQCSPSCNDHCWPSKDSKSEACQIRNNECPVSKFKCHYRCSHPNKDDSSKQNASETCCHPECLGGCSGPTAKDCYLCKNKLIEHTGECTAQCPTKTNQFEGKLLDTPNGYYEHYNLCLQECPSQTFVLGNGCKYFS